MSSLLEQLKARQLQAAAEQAAVPVDPLIGPMIEPPAAVQVAGRAENGSVVPAEAPEQPLPKGPPGSYRALRLQRFFVSSGRCVLPNADGFFVPIDEEEKKELEHFATQYGMVEYQPEDQAPAE